MVDIYEVSDNAAAISQLHLQDFVKVTDTINIICTIENHYFFDSK